MLTGGVMSRNGEPLTPNVLASMRALYATPDVAYRECGAGAAVRVIYETGENTQPDAIACADAPHCLVVWHGRLDNPAEVAKRVGWQRRTAPSPAELVAALYGNRGLDDLSCLVGDFTCAVWDKTNSQLMLCADPLGRAPLYYHLSPARVVWANKCRAVQAGARLALLPDDEFVANFLVNQSSLNGPFKGTHIVPGGHALLVAPHGVTLKRYWMPDRSRAVRYSRDSEYEEHFREIFSSAVRCRLEPAGHTFCEVSGGLDSSSIACVAAACGDPSDRERLTTLSYTFESSRTSDESRYIADVVAAIGTSSVRVTEQDSDLLAPLPPGFVPDVPAGQLCFVARQDRVATEMARRGAAVLLNGMGGDELFWSQPPAGAQLADLASRGDFRALAAECRELAVHRGRSFTSTLWSGVVGWRMPWYSRSRAPRYPAWIADAFARRHNIAGKTRYLPDDIRFPRPSQSRLYSMVRQKMRPYALEYCTSRGDIDMRYPYLDRRLLEFAFAIPIEQKVRGTETRSIVRRALGPVMPASVLRRRDKAGPSEALQRAIRHQWRPWLEQAFRDPLVSQFGYVDRDEMWSVLKRVRDGVRIYGFTKTLALELWLTALHGQSTQRLARR